MTVKEIKETHENVPSVLLAAKTSREEYFWKGMLQDIPYEYDPLYVIADHWVMGKGFYLMAVTYEVVAEIQNGMEKFRREVRKALILQGRKEGKYIRIPVVKPEKEVPDGGS